ncbi:MAG TPA: cation:proton antiporter, partial [Acidimicrobiales bacterium]
MPDVSFTDLALVMAVAFVTPLALGLLPRSPVPSVVVEVVLGIIVGPSVLGWVEADEVVRIVAVIGLAFLLFLAGLELDLRHLRGPVLRRGLSGFALSLGLALVAGVVLDAFGLVDDPLLAATILTATSLGLVIGVLKETGQSATPTGQLIIAGASIGDVAAIVLLSVLFSADGSGTG